MYDTLMSMVKVSSGGQPHSSPKWWDEYEERPWWEVAPSVKLLCNNEKKKKSNHAYYMGFHARCINMRMFYKRARIYVYHYRWMHMMFHMICA